MKAVAYCRVSTNKNEQLDSLEAQQEFFTEYARKNNYNLVKIYADEGKSGVKMKNRTQLLKLLSDAKRGMFDVVLIKDVSRLARNVVDFLTSVRKLKAFNIKVYFVNCDQTSSYSSEFMLTMLSAIAQEESANTSKRVKFGKKINAEKGRVPNIVYGYDKIIGDYFNLNINENEAKIVRSIFDMYINQNMGAAKIALELNRKNIKTKRECAWSQNAVSRILTNQIYIGRIINGKEEVEDFLTGKRKAAEKEEWIVSERPELRLISDETFSEAQRILTARINAFNITGERASDKNVFSKMIKCKCCGASFRRQVRQYKNIYIKWVCTGRNANGVDSCPNKVVIDEAELLISIKDYFMEILRGRPKVIQSFINEFNRQYKTKDNSEVYKKELTSQLNKVKKSKQKYIEMYNAEIISLEELKAKTKEQNIEIDRINQNLKTLNVSINKNIKKGGIVENILNENFKDVEGILKIEDITNNMLSRVIENIMADEQGNIDVTLKLLV